MLDKKLQMLRLYASNSEQPIMVRIGVGALHSAILLVLGLADCARLGQGIAGDVFVSQEVVNIPDCYQDSELTVSTLHVHWRMLGL